MVNVPTLTKNRAERAERLERHIVSHAKCAEHYSVLEWSTPPPPLPRPNPIIGPALFPGPPHPPPPPRQGVYWQCFEDPSLNVRYSGPTLGTGSRILRALATLSESSTAQLAQLPCPCCLWLPMPPSASCGTLQLLAATSSRHFASF